MDAAAKASEAAMRKFMEDGVYARDGSGEGAEAGELINLTPEARARLSPCSQDVPERPEVETRRSV